MRPRLGKTRNGWLDSTQMILGPTLKASSHPLVSTTGLVNIILQIIKGC